MSDRPRFTLLGKAISFLLVLGLIALGAFMVMRSGMSGGSPEGEEAEEGAEAAISEVKVEVPRLSPPAAARPKSSPTKPGTVGKQRDPSTPLTFMSSMRASTS